MATNIPSIDTNVLLRLLLQDNEKMLGAAVKLVSRYDKLAIADQAIMEVVFALGGYYEYSREEIVGALSQFLSNQHLILNRPLFSAVFPYYLKHRAVSFTDCCLAIYAKLNEQTPLYTFDVKLARDLPHVELVK